MTLAGNRILIFVDDGYEDLEFWYPKIRLEEEGAVVDVAAARKGVFYGKYGYPARADLAYKDVDAAAYDALVIPGGHAPDRIRRYKNAVATVKEMVRARKPVAAICHGPQVLISADALRGKRATCFESIKDDIINAGAEFVDAEVVADGGIITSRTPADLAAFCRAIIAALSD
ncbi:MAG TPA: type 1 glutamine amidotransferase domain-containing protein [bacterium]|nr:type 1 glutamine amidotransferase domain-containing protein [bacterium]